MVYVCFVEQTLIVSLTIDLKIMLLSWQTLPRNYIKLFILIVQLLKFWRGNLCIIIPCEHQLEVIVEFVKRFYSNR